LIWACPVWAAATINYDVIIIGGGPGGASAAIYTARADLKTLVIDKGLTAGALGITAKISNYPGVPGTVTGAELVEIMRAQAESFGAQFLTDKVVGVDLKSEPKMVMAGTGVFYAKVIILATGSMGRTSSVKGEEEFLGRGVSYCATCDGAFLPQQNGGGDRQQRRGAGRDAVPDQGWTGNSSGCWFVGWLVG
jgi:thioredoxin reductase (NADPH)